MPHQAAKDTHFSHRRRRSSLPPRFSYPSPSSASSLTRASPSLRPQRPAPSRPPSPGNTSRHSPAAACVSQPAPPASALLAWRPWPSLFRPCGLPVQPAQPIQPAQAACRDAFLASGDRAPGPLLGGPGNGSFLPAGSGASCFQPTSRPLPPPPPPSLSPLRAACLPHHRLAVGNQKRLG